MIAQFYFLLQIVAPVFVVMALGYLMRKIDILSSEADRSLTRLVVTLLAPCLAFDTIIGNDALAKPANWIIPPILGFGSVVLAIVISGWSAKVFRIPEAGARRTFVFTNSLHNYGYIPLPLCNALFDRETMGVLFAYYLGVELAFWSVAVAQLAGHSEKGSWRQALNPPIIAITTAIALNALGAKAVRIGLLPALTLLFTKIAPLDVALKSVLVIQAAMPAAIFPLVVTKVYHGDMPTALQVVLGTSLIGLITIPLWIGFGLHWILPVR